MSDIAKQTKPYRDKFVNLTRPLWVPHNQSQEESPTQETQIQTQEYQQSQTQPIYQNQIQQPQKQIYQPEIQRRRNNSNSRHPRNMHQ